MFEIKERLAAPSEVAALQRAIGAVRARFDASLGAVIAHPDSTAALTETALRDAQRELNSISNAAADIDRTLAQRSASLEALIKELTETLARARALPADPSQRALTEAFRTRLDLIDLDATRLLAVAQQRLDQIATLQNEILILQERERIAHDDLGLAEARRVKALFELQQPPLWRLSGTEFAGSVLGSSRFVGQAIPAALQFAQDHPVRVLLHFVAWLLSYALVVHLRRTFASAPVGAPTSKATSRPISASLLLMLLITPFLYPDAPSGVVQILGLVLVVPLLRILMLYLERPLHPVLITLAAVFLLERVATGVARDLLLQRVVLLVLNVAAIALFAWARSLRISAHLGLGPRTTNLVRQLGLVGIVLSTLSLVLNVLGNVDLAMLLQSTTVRAATVAAGLYAVVTVTDELVALAVHSLKARGVRSVINNERKIVPRAHRLLTIVTSIAWLMMLLASLRLLIPLTDAIADALSATWTIGNVTLSLGRLLGFVAAVFIAVRASRITQVLLHDDVLPRFALPRGVPNTISTVANYAMVLLGVLLGAGILGIGLSNLTLIVGALGVGIGFGLQNVVNNFVSGFILIFERSVQVGDTIQLSEVSGKVTQIGLRASVLRTFNGSEVVVPNGELISNRLVNWTLSDNRRRLEVSIGVAYGSDVERVHALLRDILASAPDVLDDPAPMVVFEAFGDSALNFRLYFWIAEFDTGMRIIDQVNTAIATGFAAAGIEIPFPQRDLHIRTVPS
ncbi:MAG TPA: mechanosensitive ion channel domain-containing protein [Pseudomonadales bacterium]